MPFVPYGSLSQQPQQDELDVAASLQSPEPVLNPGPKTATGSQVFGVAAKQNVGGAAGGLLGAAAAGAAMGSFFPGAGTLVGAGVGLGGALLGSYLGSEAQSVIDPTYEEDAKWLAQQYPEHKWAAIGGALAPNLIGMRPGLAPLKQLRTIPKTFANQKAGGNLLGSTWRNLTAEQQNALLNVGAGVGLGVAPTVGNLVQGRDIDIPELLTGVGSGLFLTKPWGVARKLGMHPSLSPEQERAYLHDLAMEKVLADAPATQEIVISQISPETLAQEELLQRGLQGFIAPSDLPGAPVPAVTDDGVLTLVKPAHTKSTVTDEGAVKNVRVPAEQVGNPEGLPIGYNLRAVRGAKKAAAEKAAMEEWKALLDAETRNRAEQLKLSRAEEQFSPGAQLQDEVPTLGEARAAEYLRSKNKRTTPEYHKTYADLAAEQRGVPTTEGEFPEAGKFTPDQAGPGRIELGQGRGLGTSPHEQTHAAAHYLRNSPREQDVRLHELTIKAIENDPKYQAWKAAADEQNARKNWKYSTEPEEYWAREAGAAKDLRIFDETPEVRNQRDREAATKVVDGTASVDDYIRYANNLMQYGPSFQTVMQRYGGKFGQLNAPVVQHSIAAQIPDDTDKLPADSFKAASLGLEKGAKLSERRAAMKDLAQQLLTKYPEAKVYEDYPKDFQNIIQQLRGKGSARTQQSRLAEAAKVEAEALASGKTAEEAKALAETAKNASVRALGDEPREWHAAAAAKMSEHTASADELNALRASVRRRIQRQQGFYNDAEGEVFLSPQDTEYLVEQSMWDLSRGRWSEMKGMEGKMPEYIAAQKPNTPEFHNTLRKQLYRIGDNKLKAWRAENKTAGDVELDKVQIDTEGRVYRPEGSEDAVTSPEVEARTDTAEERDLRDIYEKSLDPDSRYYQWTAAPEEFNRAFLNLQKQAGLAKSLSVADIHALKRRLKTSVEFGNPKYYEERTQLLSAEEIRHRDEIGKFQLSAETVWNMPPDEQEAFLAGWRKRVDQNVNLSADKKVAQHATINELARQFEQRWHPADRLERERQAKEFAAGEAFKRKWGTQDVWEPSHEVPVTPKPETQPVPPNVERTYEERGFQPSARYASEEPTRLKYAELSQRIKQLREAKFGIIDRDGKIAALEAERDALVMRPELNPQDRAVANEAIGEHAQQQAIRAEKQQRDVERKLRAQESKRDFEQQMREEGLATDQYSPAAQTQDENGKPIAFHYSSSKEPFTKFEHRAAHKAMYGKGFYFLDDPTIYASRKADFGGHKYEVALDLKNPASPKDVASVLREILPAGSTVELHSPTATEAERITEKLRQRGFDGFKRSIGSVTEYMVFDPNQIEIRKLDDAPIFASRTAAKYSISSMVPDLFKAEIDHVKRLDPDLGKAFERADRARVRLTGYMNNEPIHLMQQELALKPEGRDWKTFRNDLLANDSPDHRYVMWYRDQIAAGKKPNVTLTPRQQRINDAVEMILRRTYEEREKNPLTKHDTKQTPGYLPGMMDLKIAREIEVNRSGKIAQDAIKAQEDWLAAEYGRDSKEFKDRMGRFLGAFDKKQMNSAEQFGPIDLNEGVGLAPELRDKNLIRVMSRFARRYAERMAFANEVQSDAKAMARLQDDKVSLKSNPHVKNVLDRMNGVREEQEEVRMAIGGAIRSMMLQTKTGLGDVTTSFPITMKHLSAKQLGGAGMAWARGAYEGLTRKSDLFRETLRQGVNVDNSVTMEMSEDGAKNIANVLNGVRNVTNKATGRNWLEQIARTGVYEEGKWLAAENVQAVLHGTADAQQKKFVEDFFDKPEFTPEAIREAATRFVEVNQGTYGYRGLPAISEKGSTAPFLSLSRWNIEQLNNFDKFVFQPALKGNYQPLLMATLGGLIGGAAVEQVYELVSNRKSRLPTVSEIGASKQPLKGTLYKLAGLASLSGFAGFYGDMARTVGDVSFGNRAQGLTNPLWNGMQDFANIATDFATAVADGNLEDAVTQLLPVLLQTYVQNYRLFQAQMDDDEMKRRNSFRDVRMFNALNEGNVTPAIADQPNPFTNVGLRKFKKTSDLSEAAELLPGLLEGAVGRSGGDPEKMEQEFGKIKANSYQTMPSPTRRPLEFARYMEYLTKTQGPEAAAERFVDYQKQNAINQAKTAMVP